MLSAINRDLYRLAGWKSSTVLIFFHASSISEGIFARSQIQEIILGSQWQCFLNKVALFVLAFSTFHIWQESRQSIRCLLSDRMVLNALMGIGRVIWKGSLRFWSSVPCDYTNEGMLSSCCKANLNISFQCVCLFYIPGAFINKCEVPRQYGNRHYIKALMQLLQCSSIRCRSSPSLRLSSRLNSTADLLEGDNRHFGFLSTSQDFHI